MFKHEYWPNWFLTICPSILTLSFTYKGTLVWFEGCLFLVQPISRVWLCHPMDCSTSGFPVYYYLPEFAQTHVHWVHDAIQPSSSVILFTSSQSFPASEFFLMIQLFASGGQSIGASASASVLPMNIQIPMNNQEIMISFRIDWLDLLAVQGTLKSLLQHHSSKASILWCSAFFMV